jgi:hypothetical protein
VIDSAPFHQVTLQHANPVSRLAQIAAFVSPISEAHDVEFITARVLEFAERLETDHLAPSLCVAEVQSLDKRGHLTGDAGRRFLNALKSCAMNQPSDCEEFETLAKVIEAKPDLFTDIELDDIRDSYAGFAWQYSSDYVTGKCDATDPETIREEASRLENIGDLLDVNTETEQKAIRDYADQVERESESSRDWDEEGSSGGTGRSDSCSDGELDAMFGTLKH